MSGSLPITTFGEIMRGKAANGMTKQFTLEIDDVDADLEEGMEAQISFTSESGYTTTTNIADYKSGETEVPFTFTSAGRWTVTVELKDKDMKKFGSEFIFYVDCLDTPSVIVSALNGTTLDENNAGPDTASFEVKLSQAVEDDISVKLEIAGVDASAGATPILNTD